MNATKFQFAGSEGRHSFWRRLVGQGLREGIPTPFFLCSIEPVQDALRELKVLEVLSPIQVRHWLSCKTQPLSPLLRWWQRAGRCIEVVSEFELRAALKEGFAPDRILVNGPAKHHWLPRVSLPGLRVNFDSPAEAAALLPLARIHHWSVGIRCHTQEEYDPDGREFPTQFGMIPAEAIALLKRLQRAKLRLETIHFHLRTNILSPVIYERALVEVAAICREANFRPRHVDCGGGLPPPFVQANNGRPYNADFDLEMLARMYKRVLQQFPGVEQLWLENGRFLTARAGVLVVRILEVKDRGGLRQLICDGGRTTQALISIWESHDLFTVPRRSGEQRLTAVCGPTCMAFDRLTRRPLPANLRPGDHLIWLDAGAYHLPWETHFSHGLAGVLWHEDGRLTVVRPRESFEEWWGRWQG